ncbi:uncharacterized protein LOC123310915 [Coccinella septempunctata]|uniref:uncharacterized protein LOC123310915 n=1 Tax=Coccinella septempunctata TaxID=41139 RepID=UPI001D08035A|nr:uncharacterized protein LOC123310915 [Coccinella septempunctata]
MKVQVEEVIYNQETNPIAVNIRNKQVSDEFLSNVKVDVFKDSSDKTIVAAHTEKILYVGGVNPNESAFNNFLVIRNKNTNKVRLVSYDTVNMDSFTRIDNSSLKKTAASEELTTADLTKQFGTKKAIRVTEQREKMKFFIENERENLQKAVAEVTTDEGLLNQSQNEINESDTGYLPLINRNASSVDQVYELNNLVPPEVRDGLQSDVNTVLECDDLSQLPLCNFCMQNIRILKGNDDIESNSTRCKIYLFLNYLIRFLTTPIRSISKKFVLCESSSVVNFYILDNFSVVSKSNRTRSSSMRDKLICNILVLVMLASLNNQLNLETISQDMKLGIKKLQEISRMLAFTNIGTKQVALKLPLPAPVTSSRRKKK